MSGHLDETVTRDSLTKFPLTEYAAGYWFVHARFEGVSENADEGVKRLFDKWKPHFFDLALDIPSGDEASRLKGRGHPVGPPYISQLFVVYTRLLVSWSSSTQRT
jgi:hypothetical protein